MVTAPVKPGALRPGGPRAWQAIPFLLGAEATLLLVWHVPWEWVMVAIHAPAIHVRRILAVLVAIGLLAGCSAAPGSSLAPAGPSGVQSTPARPSGVEPTAAQGTPVAIPTAAPVAMPDAVVCPAPSAAELAADPTDWSGTTPGQRSRVTHAVSDGYMAALFAGVGNLDTGSTSPAMAEFKASLTSGDTARIDTATEAVLGHLRDACAIVAPFFGDPGWVTWAREVRALLEGFAGAIGSVGQAAGADSQAGIDAGWARFADVAQDHFWQVGSTRTHNQAMLPDGRTATASRIRWSWDAAAAFDGSPGSFWLAGDVPAPQWIQIDFGRDVTITGIRLLTWQDAPGDTDHLLSAGTTTGDERVLGRLTGRTSDQQWLELTPDTPATGVRTVRVTTLATPSMIGWREIEFAYAGGSLPTLQPTTAPAPCPASTTPVGSVAQAKSDPPASASDPAGAVDGDEATGWDPGPVRAGTAARGWMRVFYTRELYISGLRVLVGPGSPDATYEVVLFPPGELGDRLGVLAPVPADGGWVTIAGPNPCRPVESVYISVQSTEPAGLIREIQVLGTVVP